MTTMREAIQEESTYTPAEIDDYIAELNNDPVRMALVPMMIEESWAIPAFPHAFDTMKSELLDYQNKIPLETIKCPTLIAHGTKDGDISFS